LLHMVPFCGKYITTSELRTHVPSSWPGWDPNVESLGRHFLDGLFNSRRDEYPISPFELNDEQNNTKNKWLTEIYTSTNSRLLK
jgi:hypothetical protein